MNLSRIVPALRRGFLPLCLAALAAFLVASGIALLRGAGYEARAVVDVNQLLADENVFSNSERADRAVANELMIAESRPVSGAAAERLGGVDPENLREAVEVRQVIGTDNIGITARADDPQEAARTATEYATAYVDTRLEQRRESLTAQADAIAAELEVIEAELAALPQVRTAQQEADYEALWQQYVMLAGRELELRGTARAGDDPQQYVVAAFADASATTGFPAVVWGVAAALLTAALGALAVALVSRFRDPVESGVDLDDLELPVLGALPRNEGFWARPPGTGRSIESAAVDVLTREPVPEVLTVLAVEGQDVGAVADELRSQLRRHGSRLDVAPVTVLVDEAYGATSLSPSLARRADLVILVVARGMTRRAAVVESAAALGRIGAAPLAVLLVEPAALDRSPTGGRHLLESSPWWWLPSWGRRIRPAVSRLRVRTRSRESTPMTSRPDRRDVQQNG